MSPLKTKSMRVRHFRRVVRCHSKINMGLDVTLVWDSWLSWKVCLKGVVAGQWNSINPNWERTMWNKSWTYICPHNWKSCWGDLSICGHWCYHRMLTISYPWRLNIWLVSCLHAENSDHGTFLFLHFTWTKFTSEKMEESPNRMFPSRFITFRNRLPWG